MGTPQPVPPVPAAPHIDEIQSIMLVQDPAIRDNLLQILIQKRTAEVALMSAPKRAATGGGLLPDEEQAGETPPEVVTVSSLLPSLSKAQLQAIFQNKFLPINLCKLQARQGTDDWLNNTTLSFMEGNMVATKPKGTLKDFGHTTAIWSEGFINYTTAVGLFFATKHPKLQSGLLFFYKEIIRLATIYQWQAAVLPLAIHHH
jgi:hypothetical protein